MDFKWEIDRTEEENELAVGKDDLIRFLLKMLQQMRKIAGCVDILIMDTKT